MMEGVIAALTSVLAVGCIYWAWRKKGRALVAALGWLLASMSMVSWSGIFGPEFGVTYAIIVFVCLVWGVSFKGMEARLFANKASQRPYQRVSAPDVSILLKHGSIFLLSVPATGVLTMMLSVAVVLYLPWTLLTKVTVAIFLYPVLWGALSAWICAQQNAARPAVVLAGLFLISSLILFI